MTVITLLSLTIIFYLIYGYEFLYETYLYHLIRKDNRHNYSVYFMMIYQNFDLESSKVMAILTFIPQWGVAIVAGLAFHYDIFLAIVIQTWAFVAFCKVMTAQYFLWYLSLMPFIAINNGVIQKSPFKGLLLYLCQIGFMLYWGFYAFQLEFYGTNFFTELHYVNSGFFVINCISIAVLMRHHKLTITFEIEGENTVEKVKKE